MTYTIAVAGKGGLGKATLGSSEREKIYDVLDKGILARHARELFL